LDRKYDLECGVRLRESDVARAAIAVVTQAFDELRRSDESVSVFTERLRVTQVRGVWESGVLISAGRQFLTLVLAPWRAG
jgi:hypothetical protein